jgi:hypothetical protein
MGHTRTGVLFTMLNVKRTREKDECSQYYGELLFFQLRCCLLTFPFSFFLFHRIPRRMHTGSLLSLCHTQVYRGRAHSHNTHSHFSRGYTTATHYFFMLFCALFSLLLYSDASEGFFCQQYDIRTLSCLPHCWNEAISMAFLSLRQNAQNPFCPCAFDEWADALNGEMMETRHETL